MNKTIIITGATGFVGKKLCLELFIKGYKLKILCRSVEKAKNIIALPAEFIEWSGYEALPSILFEGAEGVIHLAGESIADGRWTNKRKEKILKSRIQTTKNICDAIKGCQNPPKVLVGASAVGIYGEGFLREVCQQWENSYDFSGRLALMRTGVVLGHGGALEKMLPPFRLGMGGPLANGKQWMSWIHIEDLVKMYIFAVENDLVSGPIDAVAPKPIQNKDFTKFLAKAVGMPAIFPVPALVLKIIFGEMSAVILDSQKVGAEKIMDQGFQFIYPDLKSALDSLVRPSGIEGAYSFSTYRWLDKNKDDVFLFFSKAENLEVITPPWLNFKILRKSEGEMKKGTQIEYKLKIKGVPAYWKTLISNWSPSDYFTDSQLKGPYSRWDHTHRFISVQGGTLMTDEVIYKVPFGPIGHVVREAMIAKDVSRIFDYRNSTIEDAFKEK